MIDKTGVIGMPSDANNEALPLNNRSAPDRQ